MVMDFLKSFTVEDAIRSIAYNILAVVSLAAIGFGARRSTILFQNLRKHFAACAKHQIKLCVRSDAFLGLMNFRARKLRTQAYSLLGVSFLSVSLMLIMVVGISTVSFILSGTRQAAVLWSDAQLSTVKPEFLRKFGGASIKELSDEEIRALSISDKRNKLENGANETLSSISSLTKVTLIMSQVFFTIASLIAFANLIAAMWREQIVQATYMVQMGHALRVQLKRSMHSRTKREHY